MNEFEERISKGAEEGLFSEAVDIFQVNLGLRFPGQPRVALQPCLCPLPSVVVAGAEGRDGLAHHGVDDEGGGAGRLPIL